MDKNDLMKYGLIAGGLFAAYWYVTSYGPNGAVKNATGQPVNESWWDSWFGGGTATTQPATTTPPAPQTQLPPGTPSVYRPNQNVPITTAPPVQQPQQPIVSQPAPPTPTQTGPMPIRESLLRASGVTTLNADQWNYYYAQITGNPQPYDLFTPNNRGELITVDTYLSRRVSAGLTGVGDIIPVGSSPGLPSMSFGGSLKRQGAMATLAGLRKHTFVN